MPRQQNRTFSFDNNDESSLNQNREPYYQHDLPSSSPPRYTDSPPKRKNNSPPPPPVHRTHINATTSYQLPPLNTKRASGQRSGGLNHSTSDRTASTITPGADNMGDEAAGGGISGVALGVANTHQRQSGVEAVRAAENVQQSRRIVPPERGYNTVGSDTPYIPTPPSSRQMPQMQDSSSSPAPSRRSNPFEDPSVPAPPSPGQLTPRGYLSASNIPMSDYPPQHAYTHGQTSYTDNPYQRFSTAWDPRVARGDIDPDEIDDDGDDTIAPPPARRSMLGLNRRSQNGVPQAAAIEGTAAGGSVIGAIGSLVGLKNGGGNQVRDASGHYGPVGRPDNIDHSGTEKSEWLNKQNSGRKRMRWLVGLLVLLVLIGAIVGGVIGGLHNRSSSDSDASSSGGMSKSAAQDDGQGDLDKDSPEIKKLLNNDKFHKVFPGMDYTPFNAQYPACLTNPPSQNNITRDMAVLSQLTSTIRLYGTDCNQTDMVLHAINKLALPGIKIWLGVWLDSNSTTNDRGLNAMYDILARNGADPFAGVIVGNEVLFRQDLSQANLGDMLSKVKTNFTSLKYDLPVAVSDLGDAWTAGLAADVDVVMSNVHPFFAGVTTDLAAGWTWDFWQQHDTILTEGTTKQNVIAEVGWPSAGGTDCGTATSCTTGSVAGIEQMNTFMDNFICQSLENKTNFFWFEAFDEPWKVSLNTPGKEWEDKWGLMDSTRKLKDGLKIPDCGGKTTE